MATDEYPYLAQLSVPDRLRLAVYVACDHGVPAIHLRVILNTAEGLERKALECEPSPEAIDAKLAYPDAFLALIHVGVRAIHN